MLSSDSWFNFATVGTIDRTLTNSAQTLDKQEACDATKKTDHTVRSFRKRLIEEDINMSSGATALTSTR
jgi:site-specific recombinase XerD